MQEASPPQRLAESPNTRPHRPRLEHTAVKRCRRDDFGATLILEGDAMTTIEFLTVQPDVVTRDQVATN